jgi:hypothetical protein
MTRDAERAYVRRWVETGKLLENVRWQELRTLDESAALTATDHLIEAALLVPLPASRRQWSGLVEWQDLMHAGRAR